MKHYLNAASLRCVDSPSFLSRIGVCIGAYAACLVTSTALATTTTWIAGNGSWDNPVKWDNGVPVVSGTAIIGVAGASVSYFDPGGNPTLSLITIDAAGGGATLNQTTDNLTSLVERVGDNATGTFVITAGTNSADLISVGRGSSGTGTFTQSGGVVNLTTTGTVGQLIVGDASGSTGAYNLQGGSLLALDVFVGLSGSNGGGRTFTQSGGTATITNSLSLGGTTGGTTPYTAGSYALSSGTLNSANVFVGLSGAGTFTQDGGVNNITGGVSGVDRTLWVAAAYGGPSTSTGTYTLNNGTLNAQTEYIGGSVATGGGGTGTFNHVAGTNNVTGQLAVVTGTYTMSGGNLIATGTDPVYQAIDIESTFALNGGTVTANGSGLVNNGNFNMSSGGILTGTGTKLNNGTFTATGGLITITGVDTTKGVLTNSGTLKFTDRSRNNGKLESAK